MGRSLTSFNPVMPDRTGCDSFEIAKISIPIVSVFIVFYQCVKDRTSNNQATLRPMKEMRA
jgi:hypothetical protein